MLNSFDNKEIDNLWCHEVLRPEDIRRPPTSPARVYPLRSPHNIPPRAPIRPRLNSVPSRMSRLRRFVLSDLHADLLDEAPAAVVDILVDPAFAALQDTVFDRLN